MSAGPLDRRHLAAWRRSPHWFDLQLFAAEDEGRTEDPTGKRISKARGEGQVAKSAEIPQALSLLVAGVIAVVCLPRIVGYEMHELRYWLENCGTMELSENSLHVHVKQVGLHLVALMWPIVLAEMVAGVGGHVAQVGWLFTWEPLRPKWNKLIPNPAKLIGRLIIGKAMLINLAKSLLKLLGVGGIAWYVIDSHLPQLLTLWCVQPYQTVEFLVDVVFEIIWKSCFLLAAVAALDYWYNHYEWKDALKMTKQEVKDEWKQAEGSPEVKKAQRKRMMEAARRRMMREIPTADVVITNPTHFAVAIKYDQSVSSAPRVVAKGEGFVAQKIKEIANEHGVPIVENKPLAQALYKGVEVGEEIPAEFYRAVAEILAMVYKTRRKSA